ncbi:MAG: outer membrane protein assembly factor BamC [Hydrogenophaga sp.]
MHTSRTLPPSARLGLIAAAALMVTGCSVLQEEKIDYRSAKQASTLDVPPDLTQLSRDTRYLVPSAVVTASAYQTAQPAAASAEATATSRVGDVRIERNGDQRWLVVGRSADQLWSPVKDFWQENGFTLVSEQQPLGLMETDWNENRAKLPQDVIRNTLGKLFDSLYSTGERDKFRTRLERNATGGTDIFISHRGMEEVYTSTSKDQTIWQPRKSDPTLENEFLRRLMLKLGATEAQAQAALATAPAAAAARVITLDQLPALQLDDGFDRAWRRVGLTLDRSGFTVVDRDRSQGQYFVRFVTAGTTETPGFFSRLLGRSKPDNMPVQYRIQVKAAADNGSTTVRVLDAQGQPDGSADARRIVQLLADDLR